MKNYLILICIFSLMACQVKDERIPVSIFQLKVEIQKALNQTIKIYEKENPNIKINVETVGAGADYGAALRAKFQSGNEPSIFTSNGLYAVLESGSVLRNLNDQAWLLEQAKEGTLANLQDPNGESSDVYGIPYTLEGYGFIYNQDIFDKAGIDIKNYTDFDDLKQKLNLLDQKIRSGELKKSFPYLEAVFSLPAKETWVTGIHSVNLVLGLEFSSTSEVFKAQTFDFIENQALKELIDLQIYFSPYRDNPSILNTIDYSTQVEGGIALERVAMIQQGNWIYPQVFKINPAIANKLSILPVPLLRKDGSTQKAIPVGVPMYWTINKNKSPEIQKASLDFLKWLYLSETGKKLIVDTFQFIPPFKGYENITLPNNPLNNAVNNAHRAGWNAPWFVNIDPTGWGKDTLGSNIQAYIAQKMSWTTFVEQAQSTWQKLRKQESVYY